MLYVNCLSCCNVIVTLDKTLCILWFTFTVIRVFCIEITQSGNRGGVGIGGGSIS